MIDFKRCLEKRKLVKIGIEKDIILKEINESSDDFKRAKKSFAENEFKWTIIQTYYSMFHATKALVYAGGYREKSHYCLMVALEELYVNQNKLEPSYVKMFKDVMRLREDADYGMIYSQHAAILAISNAEKFIERARVILKEFM